MPACRLGFWTRCLLIAGFFSGSALAQETPLDTVCQLETGVAPVVELQWFEQPAAGEVNDLRGSLLRLVARNTTRSWQFVRVTFDRFGNQRLPREFSRWLWLAPGARRFVPVSLRALGFDPWELRTSASVRAHVEVFGHEHGKHGWQLRDQSLSPKLYFHGIRERGKFGARLLVYDHAAMMARFNFGDVRGELFDDVRTALAAIPRPRPPLELQAIIDPMGGSRRPDDVVFGGPGQGDHTFCVRLAFETEDSGVGEDFYAQQGAQNVPASHARVEINNFNFGADSRVVDDGRLNANGCISFDHEPNSDIWTVLVISLADVPRSDDASETNRFLALDSGGNVATWAWHGELDVQNSPLFFYADGSALTNIFAGGTFSLVRFSDGLGDQTLYAMNDACPTIPDNSCNSTFVNVENDEIPVAFIHPDHNAHKFAISHEVGHAVVHRFFFDAHPGKNGMYDLNTGGSECTFSGAHALHSEEHSGSALTEGFAQFYATAVWNDTAEQDAAFYYYKDDYKNGTVKEVDMADGPLGGVDAYLANECTGTDQQKAGHGVELDWARQFWDYRTQPGSAPTNLEILEQYSTAVGPPFFPNWTLGNSYDRMFDAIGDFDALHATNFLDRWDSFDELNGIDF